MNNVSIVTGDICQHCGCHTYELRKKNMHVGMYCSGCGKYVKWLSKDEKRKFNVDELFDESTNGTTEYVFLDDLISPEELPFD